MAMKQTLNKMVSDVPLTEDILAKKPPFIFSYYEWLRTSGQQQIVQGDENSEQVTNIFVVPDNKVFYLTSVSGSMNSNGDARASFGKGTTSSYTRFFIIRASLTGNTHGELSFPIPLEFNEGENVVMDFEKMGIADVWFSITGFLIDKRII